MWIEKLGPITDRDYVYVDMILRSQPCDEGYETLHTFKSKSDAINAFNEWKKESEAMKTAAKEYKFNLIKLSPKEVENIIRERIVRDNPGIDPQSVYMEYDEARYDGYTVQWRNK